MTIGDLGESTARGRGAVAGDDGEVGGGEVEGEEVFGADPADGDVFVGLRCGAAGGEAADKRKHLDDDAAVVVDEGQEGVADDDLATEFLAQLAGEGGFGRLTGFNLAAGKLPFQGEVFLGRALGDEDLAGPVFEDGADDGERGRLGGIHESDEVHECCDRLQLFTRRRVFRT